jgi:hypothetical protein
MTKRSHPRGFRSLLTIVFSSLAVCGLAHGQVYYQDQEVRVHDSPSLMARSHEPLVVLLTSLDTVFHDKDICCGWDSALGDSGAAADPKSLEDVAAKVGGRHLMSDGRPIKVTAEYLAPEAVNAGHVVTMIANQHAPLMLWNSHLYVVHGVVFVRTEDWSSGETAIVIRKFLLWDTRFSDSRRSVVFDRETEDPSKVQGLLFLQVEPRTGESNGS